MNPKENQNSILQGVVIGAWPGDLVLSHKCHDTNLVYVCCTALRHLFDSYQINKCLNVLQQTFKVCIILNVVYMSI